MSKWSEATNLILFPGDKLNAIIAEENKRVQTLAAAAAEDFRLAAEYHAGGTAEDKGIDNYSSGDRLFFQLLPIFEEGLKFHVKNRGAWTSYMPLVVCLPAQTMAVTVLRCLFNVIGREVNETALAMQIMGQVHLEYQYIMLDKATDGKGGSKALHRRYPNPGMSVINEFELHKRISVDKLRARFRNKEEVLAAGLYLLRVLEEVCKEQAPGTFKVQFTRPHGYSISTPRIWRLDERVVKMMVEDNRLSVLSSTLQEPCLCIPDDFSAVEKTEVDEYCTW
jgi:hypothetical protein